MTRYALVPVEATEEMQKAWSEVVPSISNSWKVNSTADWSAMLAASPGQGAVTAEQLEAAAIDAYVAFSDGFHVEWHELAPSVRALWVKGQAAGLRRLGLTVQP